MIALVIMHGPRRDIANDIMRDVGLVMTSRIIVRSILFPLHYLNYDKLCI